MSQPAPTLIEVLRRSTEYLRDHGSESARLDAELLTAHVLGLRRLDLYLQHDRPLSDAELGPMRAVLRRRGRREPVAYILGRKEFFGRDFTVSPAVLIPRPETELLVEQTLAWCRRHHPDGAGLRIADLGTGSGCIAVTLAAELPGASVTGSDVSIDALACSAQNATAHGVAERVSLVSGRWDLPLRELPSFDVVVANPPYVTTAEMTRLDPTVAGFEPAVALTGGDDGLDSYRAIASGLRGLLATPGFVAMEIDPRRATGVVALFDGICERSAITVVDDLTRRPRLVCVELS